MTKDSYLLAAVHDTPWAILPSKLHDITAVLRLHAAGVRLTAEDIRARLGGDPPAPRRSSATPQGISLIPIFGVLARRMDLVTQASGGTSTDTLAADVRAAVADPAVTALLLVVDSPGGTVAGITELAAVIREARTRKSVTAMIDTVAASAALWLASQADHVVITPSGEAGSLGILAIHQSIAGALEREGIETTVITAGQHKDEGIPLKPLTTEAQAAIQRRVDAAYARFVSDVALGRGVSVATVERDYGQGRMFSAEDAARAGMVDEIAPFDAVMARLNTNPSPTRPITSRATRTALHAGDSLWWYRMQLDVLAL